jgi:hypothetical protein
VIRDTENGKKRKVIVCRKFVSVNSTIQAIWKNKNYQCVRTERIEIKRFRQPKRSDVDKTLLSGFSNTGVTLYQWQVLFVL